MKGNPQRPLPIPHSPSLIPPLSKFADYLESVLLTLWVGGLWAIGYLAAPVLFANLPDRMLAGALAGRLFAGIAWVGLGCGIVVLALGALRLGAAAMGNRQSWIVAAMLALTLAGHFGVQPVLQALKDEVAPAPVMDSPNRAAFGRWHGISSGIYLVESLLGLVVLRSRRVS